MSFSRSNEFDRSTFNTSSESQELESAFKRNYLNVEKTNITGMQASLGSVGYLNNYEKKTTVAEMIADYVERTGLAEYQKELQALEQKENNIKTAQENKEVSMEGPSLLDVDGVEEAINSYVNRYQSFQLAPVIDFIVNEIIPSIKSNNNGSLGDVENINKIISKDPYSEDPKLTIYISDKLLNNNKNPLSDFNLPQGQQALPKDDVFDILTPSSKY